MAVAVICIRTRRADSGSRLRSPIHPRTVAGEPLDPSHRRANWPPDEYRNSGPPGVTPDVLVLSEVSHNFLHLFRISFSAKKVLEVGRG